MTVAAGPPAGDAARSGAVAAIIWPLMVAVLLGLAITGAAYHFRRQAEESRVRQVLEFRGEWRARDFASKLRESQDRLTATVVYAAKSQSFTPEDFQHFAGGMSADINADQSPIEAIDWLPRVTREKRAAFEAQSTQSGLPGFHIFQRTESGAQIPVADKDEYLPIAMQWKSDQSPPALGLDVSSDADRAVIAAEARDIGKPQESPSFQPPVAGVAPTYIVFWPIYEGGDVPATLAQRRTGLRGFVIGVFRTITVLNAAIKDTPAIPESIEFYTSFGSTGAASGAGSPIAFFSPAVNTITESPPANFGADTQYRSTRSFDVMGVHWRLESAFSSAAVAAERSADPNVVLIAGLVLTGIFAGYTIREGRRRYANQRLIGERTQALGHAAAELLERVRTERALEEKHAELRNAEARLRRTNVKLAGAVAVAEEASSAKSRILAAIIDSTQDAIVGKNLDGIITSWNPAAERLFGYPADEAVGHDIRMLLPLDQECEEELILRRIAQGEVIAHFETKRRHKGGHLIDVSVTISPIRDAAGRVIGASKIARDITEAKRAAVELEQHREHLEELVVQRTAQIAEATQKLRDREEFITIITDNLPGMVGYWDRLLQCRFANRAFYDWFGRTSEEMLRMTMPEIFGEEHFNYSLPWINGVLAGQPQEFDREILKPSGETGFVRAHYIPDRDGDAVVGFFVLVFDITLLKQAEAELRQVNEKLADAVTVAEDASCAKSQFLATMSHEIRTPMSGVIGMLEILGHTTLDDEQVRMIGTISSSARTLLQIINDILDFSKIEARQLRIEAIAADPTQIIESTTWLFLGAAVAKGVALRCFVAPSVRGRYLTDPARLRQVLSNLVSNAIKFTPSGVVTITVELVADDDGTENLRFIVADTGVGISREAQARLFQPFSQADDSTAREFGGTGLGLAICLRLVELMGGTIELTSMEGKGTQVTLALPARPVEKGAEDTALDLRGVRVALVTSDEEEQRYFAAYLAYWGAEVTVIEPASGLPAAPPEPFTLILAPGEAESAWLGQVQGAIPVGPPRRVVLYSYDDIPVDRKPASDIIATTALSRGRLITAVAVAAGRQSPELEVVHGLPRHAPRGAVPSRDRATSEGRLILLAEDHPVNRDVILRQLRLLGYAADAAGDGVAALAALTRTRYALLLTDCSMPKMDGFELTRRIRLAETGDRHLPIIALTANALEGEEAKCLAAGMDDYLAKPAEMSTLRGLLERWLPVGAPAVAPSATLLAPNATGEAAALNLATLAEYCGDDPAAIRESLALFMDTLKGDIERLSAAVARNDADESQLFAHRIKGAARIVGGSQLASYSEAVELSAEGRDWPAIERDMPRLLNAILRMTRMYDEITSA